MKEKDKKELLLDFLDSKIFNPVLEAQPDFYSSERDRKMLTDVKKIAAMEKNRFHKEIETSEEIRKLYFQELWFEMNGIMGKELEDLELPRLKMLERDFIDLCSQLNIN